MASTQLPAPISNQQGADKGLDQFHQLEEKLAAMEKKDILVGRHPRLLAEDICSEPFPTKY